MSHLDVDICLLKPFWLELGPLQVLLDGIPVEAKPALELVVSRYGFGVMSQGRASRASMVKGVSADSQAI